MNDQKKTPSIPMTQVPTAPRVPLALDASMFQLGQREAMRSMRQLDQAVERKLNSVDQAGHAPGVNSMLD